MGRLTDALRAAEAKRRARVARTDTPTRKVRVLTVANPKGGAGKTTLALNLAVTLRALHEDLPILIVTLDDQSALTRALALEPIGTLPTIETCIRNRTFAGAVRVGEFGLAYVDACNDSELLRDAVRSIDDLAVLFAGSALEGMVVIDTKADLGPVTAAALATSDLVLTPVRDRASLDEARKVYRWLDERGRPREAIRAVLAGIDLRVKFNDEGCADVLALLLGELGRAGIPHCPTFLSRSPAVEALMTSPDDRPRTILHGAPRSIVARQLRSLAEEVFEALETVRQGETHEPLSRRTHRDQLHDRELARMIAGEPRGER